MSVEEKRKMLGSLKSFDVDDHNEYDNRGKVAMMDYLNKKLFNNLTTIENPNKYGIDLLTITSTGEVIHCWEIEVRYGNWQGDIPFPFRDINCIERKDYMWRKDPEFYEKIPYKVRDNASVAYVQLNKECTRSVIIDSEVILKHELKPWANRKSSNEYVRQVPISETFQFRISP
jgi:hypothetical protein